MNLTQGHRSDSPHASPAPPSYVRLTAIARFQSFLSLMSKKMYRCLFLLSPRSWEVSWLVLRAGTLDFPLTFHALMDMQGYYSTRDFIRTFILSNKWFSSETVFKISNKCVKSDSEHEIDLKQDTQVGWRIRWQEPLGDPVSPSLTPLWIHVEWTKRLCNRERTWDPGCFVLAEIFFWHSKWLSPLSLLGLIFLSAK